MSAIDTIADGRKTVAVPGTAEQIVPDDAAKQDAQGIIVIALLTNAGVVVVGGEDTVVAAEATRAGIPLEAGQDTVIEGLDSLSLVWLDAVIAGEGVTWTYVRDNRAT